MTRRISTRGVRRQETLSTRTPIYATHYFDATREPFLNLADLPADQLESILLDLNRVQESRARYRRVYGSRYMELRRLTEKRMREDFRSRGGKPERKSPHYFVLGDSPWFEGLYPECKAVRIDLADLPDRATSATYPDSFVSMNSGPEFGLPHPVKPYHGRVFRLAELPRLIEEWGLPRDDASRNDRDYHKGPFEKYVEIQLWTDDPVRAHLRPAPPAV